MQGSSERRIRDRRCGRTLGLPREIWLCAFPANGRIFCKLGEVPWMLLQVLLILPTPDLYSTVTLTSVFKRYEAGRMDWASRHRSACTRRRSRYLRYGYHAMVRDSCKGFWCLWQRRQGRRTSCGALEGCRLRRCTRWTLQVAANALAQGSKVEGVGVVVKREYAWLLGSVGDCAFHKVSRVDAGGGAGVAGQSASRSERSEDGNSCFLECVSLQIQRSKVLLIILCSHVVYGRKPLNPTTSEGFPWRTCCAWLLSEISKATVI